MRIALVSPNRDAYSETFIQQHRKYIEGQVLFYYEGYLPKKLEGELLINPRTLRVKHIVKGHFRLNKFSLSELLILNSFKEKKIEVVFAEYGNTAMKLLPICKALNLPFIVHFHGHDASVISELEQASYYKELFSYAHFVIVVSKKMYSDFLKWGCPQEKLIYNPYGPRPEFFKLQPVYNNRQFIAVGRFTEKKAPYYLLLSFKKVLESFPDAKLIVGGEGELLQVCKNLSKQFGIEEKINFPGILTAEEFQRLLEESCCFVQHSVVAANGDTEGTPVSILEAAAAGLPVISTRHAGIPDVVEDGKTGFLVKEHDVKGMARYMVDILKNPAQAKKMGEAGRIKVKEDFTLERHIHIINDLIKKSVANDG